MRLAFVLAGALASLPTRALAEDSVSCGAANRGALANAAELPLEGDGFVIPEPWRSRDMRFGTSELVGVIQRAASAVSEAHPGAVLGVADMSRQAGGACPGHQSHQSGRDADLLYYAVDADGDPFAPDEHMPYYNRKGRAYYARKPVWARSIPERFFDVERNWALVKSLITDADVELERIFVSPRIERWLVQHAKAVGEDEELVHKARVLLHRPRDSEPHNDHMHVRIKCSAEDVAAGRCRTNFKRRKNGKWRSRVRCPREPRQNTQS